MTDPEVQLIAEYVAPCEHLNTEAVMIERHPGDRLWLCCDCHQAVDGDGNLVGITEAEIDAYFEGEAGG